jgi:hypothetical protein
VQGGVKVQFNSTLRLTSFHILALFGHIVKIGNIAQQDINSED